MSEWRFYGRAGLHLALAHIAGVLSMLGAIGTVTGVLSAFGPLWLWVLLVAASILWLDIAFIVDRRRHNRDQAKALQKIVDITRNLQNLYKYDDWGHGTPAEQFERLRAEVRAISSEIRNGDRTRDAELVWLAHRLRSIARAHFASSRGYWEVLEEVEEAMSLARTTLEVDIASLSATKWTEGQTRPR